MMSCETPRTFSQGARIFGLGALALSITLASAAATAQDKKLYLLVDQESNEIPLATNTSVRIRTDGNLEATCKLTDGKCPNIGTQSGNGPEITFPNVELQQSTTAKTLTWNASTAVACYGATPSGLAIWNKGWPNSNGNTTTQAGGMSLASLSQGVHTFGIKCYAEDGAVGTQTATVTVTAPPVISDSCAAYLDSLSPDERANFEAYRASNRGMTRDTSSTGIYNRATFASFLGITPGAHTGGTGATANNLGLPGNLAADKYIALEFTMLPEGTGAGTGTGKFKFELGEFLTSGLTKPIAATISPCEGDFRPRNTAPGADPYLRAICRGNYGISAALYGSVSDPGRCSTPANQKMYLNVSLRNLFTSGVAFPLTSSTIPDDECGSTAKCGLNITVSN